MDKDYKHFLIKYSREIVDQIVREVNESMHYTVEQIVDKLNSDLACTQQTEHLINNPILRSINKVALLCISAYEMQAYNGFLTWVCCKRLKKEEIDKLKKDGAWVCTYANCEKDIREYKAGSLKIIIKHGLVKCIDYGMHIDELLGKV